MFSKQTTLVLITLSNVLLVSSRTMCVRPDDSDSVYEVSRKGASIARLTGLVANQVTRDYLLGFLSSSGHSALVCDQGELDTMVREYQACVRQVQHHLVCGGNGGVCGWVQALVDTCTDKVLGQCMARELVDLLVDRQKQAIFQNKLMSGQNCEDNVEKDLMTILLKRVPVRQSLTRRHFLATKMLRLG